MCDEVNQCEKRASCEGRKIISIDLDYFCFEVCFHDVLRRAFHGRILRHRVSVLLKKLIHSSLPFSSSPFLIYSHRYIPLDVSLRQLCFGPVFTRWSVWLLTSARLHPWRRSVTVGLYGHPVGTPARPYSLGADDPLPLWAAAERGTPAVNVNSHAATDKVFCDTIMYQVDIINNDVSQKEKKRFLDTEVYFLSNGPLSVPFKISVELHQTEHSRQENSP